MPTGDGWLPPGLTPEESERFVESARQIEGDPRMQAWFAAMWRLQRPALMLRRPRVNPLEKAFYAGVSLGLRAALGLVAAEEKVRAVVSEDEQPPVAEDVAGSVIPLFEKKE